MYKKLFWLILVLLILITMISAPKIIFDAAIKGVQIWANILLPALLPFFIIANLLMKLGFINFLGILLEPVMRPLFNIPGTGGFVMAIGFTSGFPISSLLTADLRAQGKLTTSEAERLMSFTNNASPLFMFSAISIGMYHSPQLGYILAAGHYLSNLIIGVILGLFSKRASKTRIDKNIIRKAFHSLYGVPSLPIGQVLGDSITKAIKSIVTIGGFVVLFSITLASFTETGIISALNYLFMTVLFFIGFDLSLAPALSTGIFEVTLGVKSTSETSAHLYQQVAITASILAWSGLSIHAQVANFISKTDIKITTFIFTRLAQSLLAPIITLLFLKRYETVLVSTSGSEEMSGFLPVIAITSPLDYLILSSFWLLTILLILTTVSMIMYFFIQTRRIFN